MTIMVLTTMLIIMPPNMPNTSMTRLLQTMNAMFVIIDMKEIISPANRGVTNHLIKIRSTRCRVMAHVGGLELTLVTMDT